MLWICEILPSQRAISFKSSTTSLVGNMRSHGLLWGTWRSNKPASYKTVVKLIVILICFFGDRFVWMGTAWWLTWMAAPFALPASDADLDEKLHTKGAWPTFKTGSVDQRHAAHGRVSDTENWKHWSDLSVSCPNSFANRLFKSPDRQPVAA